MTISTFEETAVLSVVLGRCDLRRHCLHKSLVDHSFTTDKRGNNGDCTSQKFWKRRCSEQKRLKINGNYYKKHKKSLGKDEVGSSNLPSSSKKHRKLRFSVLFCCKNAANGASQNVGQLLAHTVTHTRNKLYPRKWTRDFDPWPRSADTHLTHRVRSAAPVL